MQAITIGCDPELWLVRNETVVPAVGLFPGRKDEPYAVPNSRIGLKVHEDNVTLEFNINPVEPALFSKAIAAAKKELTAFIVNLLGDEYSYLYGTEQGFKPEQLTSEQARTFGCDPDQMAYERGDYRKPPTPEAIGNFRFAGGHIHFGYDKNDPTCPPDFAIIQGVEAFGYLRYMRDWDRQGERRQWYGIPGLYRSKPYGVEYRTPGNRWVGNPEYAKVMADVVQQIVSKPAKYQELYQRINWDQVKDYINTNGNPGKGNTAYYDTSIMYEELKAAPEEKEDK